MTDATQSHKVERTLHEVVFYPEHDPRKASPEYNKVHNHLINVLDEPCWSCGVKKSTLGDKSQNPKGAKQMETHHWRIEWALTNAIDPAKILADFPELGAADEVHLRQWLDSEGNMLVLCDICHRNGNHGIHSITYPVWVAQRYLQSNWDIASGLVNYESNLDAIPLSDRPE